MTRSGGKKRELSAVEEALKPKSSGEASLVEAGSIQVGKLDPEALVAGKIDPQAHAEAIIKAPKLEVGRKQFAITMQADLLDKVDRLAKKMGQNRTTVINLAVYQALTRGLIA